MQEDYKMSSMDIHAYINNLRKSLKFTEETLKLVESDLKYGLSIDEVDEYLLKKFDYSQMEAYSICLRNGYSKEVKECITKENLTEEQRSVALEFYEKGVPIETIAKITDNNAQTAVMMRQHFENILEKNQQIENSPKDTYAEKLFQQIKSLVEKIEFQSQQYDILHKKLRELEISRLDEEKEQQYLQQLAEKDDLLEEQQNKLNDANISIIKLKNEKEQMEKCILEIKRESSGNSNHTMQEEQLKHEKHKIKQKRKKFSIRACFSKPVHKKKLDIVKLVAEKNLNPSQIVQIRNAIEKGLHEDQILTLINSQVPAEQMEEIICIALYENKQKERR